MTRKKEGSGIGLALVKELVELHGGNIFVRSEIGKGTEFIIDLPYKIANELPIAYDEIASTKDDKVDRIRVEFSDIYSLLNLDER